MALNGDILNPLSAGGKGVVEGRIAVVQADIVATTAYPDEECVVDVEVWVEVRRCFCSRMSFCSSWGVLRKCVLIDFLFPHSFTTRACMSSGCLCSGLAPRRTSPLGLGLRLASEVRRTCPVGKSPSCSLGAQVEGQRITAGHATPPAEVCTPCFLVHTRSVWERV